MRVIIDTNIIISGLISNKSAPFKIIDAVLQRCLIPLVSQTTLAELKDVLQRSHLQVYFKRSGVLSSTFFKNFRQLVEEIEVIPQVLQISDKKDQPFVDLAATFPKPSFIITGDKDFTERAYFDVPVICATQFVETILNKVINLCLI
jgi:putative PIN family toxin of toxin-antitoxin system